MSAVLKRDQRVEHGEDLVRVLLGVDGATDDSLGQIPPTPRVTSRDEVPGEQRLRQLRDVEVGREGRRKLVGAVEPPLVSEC